MNSNDARTTLLVLECSPRGEASTSHHIGKLLADVMASRLRRMSVRVRSLAEQPLPPISADAALAFATPPERLDARQRACLALPDELIAELKTMGIADVHFAAFDRTSGSSDPLGEGAAFVHAWVETWLGRSEALSA